MNSISNPTKLSLQNNNNDNIPLVSIICNTYQHKVFITDTIEGFLMQETTFPVEILIHDDASTDGTAKIVKSYEEKYPNLIKPIYQVENQYSQGIKPFVKFQYPRAQGKYIALCEGDDYWTEPTKLQKQVTFLENNRDFSITFHNGWLLENGNLKDDTLNLDQLEITTILDLCKKNYIRTASCVFRNKLIGNFPELYCKSPAGDYFLHLLNAQYGQIKFFPEKMSVYRIHSQSLWSSKTRLQQLESSSEVYKILIQYFKDDVKEALLSSYFDLITLILKNYKNENNKLSIKLTHYKSGLNNPYFIFENYDFFVIFKSLVLKGIHLIKKKLSALV